MQPYVLKGLSTSITFRNILLDDSNTDWYRKTTECMDRIWDMAIGRRMLDLIRMAQHEVKVLPSATGKNTCKSGGKNEYERFVTLRQAFMQVGGRQVPDELEKAITKAESAGVRLEFIASQLARGLSLATIHTDKNVAPRSGVNFDAQHRFLTDKEKQKFDNRSARQVKKGDVIVSMDERTNRAHALLVELISGTQTRINMDIPRLLPEEYRGAKTEKTHTIADDLVRILRSWCEPGAGTPCDVKFNPDGAYACDLDIEGTTRPPAIGLAHELCHAWRNVAGLRLFEDATRAGVDDDEVMTTGFPPYENEIISENLFRAQWAGEALRMRTDYDTYKVESQIKQQILSGRGH
jgi:hypothetical protein